MIQYISKPFKWFFKLEAASGLVLLFAAIIALIIIGRYAIGLYFQKKFSKRPPPGVVVEVVSNKNFSQSLESYCTSLSSKNSFYNINRNEYLEPIEFNKKDNKEVIKNYEIVKCSDFKNEVCSQKVKKLNFRYFI